MKIHHSFLVYTARVAALVLFVALASGCGGGGGSAPASQSSSTSTRPSTSGTGSAAVPPAVTQAQEKKSAVPASLVAADNSFGLALFTLLEQQASGSNVAISPTSIALVLQIIQNGAVGATQQAMLKTLQLSGTSVASINTANAALEAAFLDPDPNITLTVANSLWMQLAQNTVVPAFTQTNQTFYDAMIGDLAGAPADVNAWISNETEGLITDIMPASNMTDEVAVIVNALYFKGAWSTPFDTNMTSAATFTRTDGSAVPAEMMHQLGTYQYLRGSTFQVLRLPYGTSRKMSMLIVLPDSAPSLQGLIASLTPDIIDGWISQFTSEGGSIGLPRFTSTYGASLPEPLSALGMGIAFSPVDANFSALAPHVYLSDVEHKTVVQVDESGTTAAAGTSGVIGVTAVVKPQFTMTMDHPFFYAIRDDATGALLLIGALQTPDE
jgi:serine protease inhibitor